MRYYVSVIQNTENGENRKKITAYSGKELGEEVAKSKALALYHSEMSESISSDAIYGALISVTNSHAGILVMDEYGVMLEDEEEPEDEETNE